MRMEETFMYMAVISGWDEVKAFSEDEEKAKKLAIRKKKEYLQSQKKEQSKIFSILNLIYFLLS